MQGKSIAEIIDSSGVNNSKGMKEKRE